MLSETQSDCSDQYMPLEKHLMWLVANHHDVVMPFSWQKFFWLGSQDKINLTRLCDYRNEAVSRLLSHHKDGKVSATKALESRFYLRTQASNKIVDYCRNVLSIKNGDSIRVLTGWEAESYYYALKHLQVLPSNEVMNELTTEQTIQLLKGEKIAGSNMTYERHDIEKQASICHNFKKQFVRWVTWKCHGESKCPICNVVCDRSRWFNQTFAFEKKLFRVCESCFAKYCVDWQEHQVTASDVSYLYQLPMPEICHRGFSFAVYGFEELSHDTYQGFVNYRNMLIESRFNRYHQKCELQPYVTRKFADLIQLRWLEHSAVDSTMSII